MSPPVRPDNGAVVDRRAVALTLAQSEVYESLLELRKCLRLIERWLAVYRDEGTRKCNRHNDCDLADEFARRRCFHAASHCEDLECAHCREYEES